MVGDSVVVRGCPTWSPSASAQPPLSRLCRAQRRARYTDEAAVRLSVRATRPSWDIHQLPAQTVLSTDTRAFRHLKWGHPIPVGDSNSRRNPLSMRALQRLDYTPPTCAERVHYPNTHVCYMSIGKFGREWRPSGTWTGLNNGCGGGVLSATAAQIKEQTRVNRLIAIVRWTLSPVSGES